MLFRSFTAALLSGLELKVARGWTDTHQDLLLRLVFMKLRAPSDRPG